MPAGRAYRGVTTSSIAHSATTGLNRFLAPVKVKARKVLSGLDQVTVLPAAVPLAGYNDRMLGQLQMREQDEQVLSNRAASEDGTGHRRDTMPSVTELENLQHLVVPTCLSRYFTLIAGKYDPTGLSRSSQDAVSAYISFLLMYARGLHCSW